MTEGGGYDAARRQILSWREKGEELHGSSAGEGVGMGWRSLLLPPRCSQQRNWRDDAGLLLPRSTGEGRSRGGGEISRHIAE
jgi:hypothetical protein